MDLKKCWFSHVIAGFLLFDVILKRGVPLKTGGRSIIIIIIIIIISYINYKSVCENKNVTGTESELY